VALAGSQGALCSPPEPQRVSTLAAHWSLFFSFFNFLFKNGKKKPKTTKRERRADRISTGQEEREPGGTQDTNT